MKTTQEYGGGGDGFGQQKKQKRAKGTGTSVVDQGIRIRREESNG
jgi:hypothetical protein